MSCNLINSSSAISVCLASFNGERFILDQVSSILIQLEAADELIISDNGSTDTTLALLATIVDKRIKIVSCHRKGVVANFENALLQASNNFIILSDQDDIWMPGRLEVARSSLEDHQLSVVGLTFVNENLEPLSQAMAIQQPSLSLFLTLLRNGYTGCAMAFRRELLLYILPFPNRVPMHDWWIAVVAISMRIPIHISKDELILYRRHELNVSATGGTSRISCPNQFFMRLNLLVSLVIRLAVLHATFFFCNLRRKK